MPTKNYVPRVTQLDALQLDNEVIDILKGHLSETSKYFPPGLLTPVTPELDLLLRSLIFNFSLYKNNGTFGQQMLSLQYDTKLVSKGKLRWFYFYSIFLRYLRDRIHLSYTTNRKAQSFLDAVERMQIIGDFLNLLRFLQTGKSPSLIDYLLNLEISTDRNFSNRYTDYTWTRELLWHSFIEILGFAAPFLSMSFVRRIVTKRLNIFRNKSDSVSSFTNTVPNLSLNTKCAECGNSPILPYYMGCKHVFCHFCLEANRIDNPTYTCPRCSFNGPTAMPVPCG